MIRRRALERSGGIQAMSNALIDDCILARRIKAGAQPEGGRIWLGLSKECRSLREHRGIKGVWPMVARTAFTQLRYSILLLAVAVLGMTVTYLVPPISLGGGIATLAMNGSASFGWALAGCGALSWMMMAGTYIPTLRWYNIPVFYSLLMPLTGAIYTLMTVDSALRHWRGRGGAWKGRIYSRRSS